MSKENTAAKDTTMQLAEEAREAEWKFPSFTAEMFRGNFCWNLLHPYPVQDAQDKKIGDAVLEKTRAVLEANLDPIEVDRTGVYPKKVLEELAKIGVMGMKTSPEYGGLGLSFANYARIVGFVASYCQSTAAWVSAHQSIGVPEPLKTFGTPEQKKKYLPRLATGEISAFALTEPEVGSDPAKMSTTATPSADGRTYKINGRKLWITNGPDADVILVMAKTPPKVKDGKEIPQISAFIVETKTPGFSVSKRCDFMGLRGLSNGELLFEDVEVPAENLIGQTGQGLKIALTTLNTGRIGVPAAGVGGMKNNLRDAKKWITERVQWGRPVGEHQVIAKKVANYTADTFAMESILTIACSFADRKNADVRLEAAAAKYFCTERAWADSDDLLQAVGGRGFESATSMYRRGEYPYMVERALRDSRVGRIFEGSTEIMQLIMAREAMDTHLRLMMPILMPKKKDKEKSMISRVLTAVKFYAAWYPKTWMPASVDFNVSHLGTDNRGHLAFAAKSCKRLARKMFHTMAKYGPKLEYQQIILGNFVEIGVDLFVMSACLARAEALLAINPGDPTPDGLADLFCQGARERIARNFAAIGKNHNKLFDKTARKLMDGQLDWMVTDVYADLPPAYRNYAENQYQPPAKKL